MLERSHGFRNPTKPAKPAPATFISTISPSNAGIDNMSHARRPRSGYGAHDVLAYGLKRILSHVQTSTCDSKRPACACEQAKINITIGTDRRDRDGHMSTRSLVQSSFYNKQISRNSDIVDDYDTSGHTHAHQRTLSCANVLLTQVNTPTGAHMCRKISFTPTKASKYCLTWPSHH